MARELARRKGQPITEVVIESLRESLARENGGTGARSLASELREIGQRCAALPDLDTRSPEEILGFDDYGVPR